MADTITNTDIATAALEPAEMQGDQGSVKQRTIDELLKAKAAIAVDDESSAWGGALRVARLVPPGATTR